MSETNSNQRATAWFLLIILTLIWGTSFILIKKGLQVFSADEVGAVRVVAASMFLLPIAFFNLKELEKHHYWKLFTSGMLGIFIPAFLFAVAQTKMESAITGILNSLTPIFVMLIGVLLFNQRFRKQSLLGIIIGLGGTVLLIVSKTDNTIDAINIYGLLVIMACICYGINVNFIKSNIADLKSITIASVSLMLIGPLAIVYLFGFTNFLTTLSTHENAWQATSYLILLGLMSTSIATILFNLLIKRSTPLFASSITYLIPMVAVGWGLLDGEKLALGHFLGMAAIILGVYLANKK
jgi:drug/metabolite transporter (DMT)-like permease